MSQENVEAARRSTELWLDGDFDGWLATIDPDVGWISLRTRCLLSEMLKADGLSN